MTTEIEDRKRRRGGVLLALILAVIAAWLVYLWLDGIESNRDADADGSVATTVVTSTPATSTTVAPTTTTTGHGNDNHDGRASQARAEAVVAYLVDGGVDETILTAIGYGEEQPNADDATPEGRQQNRRIEFTVSAA